MTHQTAYTPSDRWEFREKHSIMAVLLATSGFTFPLFPLFAMFPLMVGALYGIFAGFAATDRWKRGWIFTAVLGLLAIGLGLYAGLQITPPDSR